MVLSVNIHARASKTKVRNHFFRTDVPRPRKLRLDQHQLRSGMGDMLKGAANPLESLRDLHEKHLLRIVELYKIEQDPVAVAFELAALRQVLTVQAFRLAAGKEGDTADFALLMGGSAIRGDHTFLTDVDTVVVPHTEADREAALRVQDLMLRNLAEMAIFADEVMPNNFDALPIARLPGKFPVFSAAELKLPFNLSWWMSNGAFYRFLMDIKVIDTWGKVKPAAYTEQLGKLQHQLVYDRPEELQTLCRESYQKSRDITEERNDLRTKGKFNIKNDALRQFYYAMYAVRARYRIKDPAPGTVLNALLDKGLISAEEKQATASALDFFLDLRHLIGFSYPLAEDSSKLDKKTIQMAAYAKGVEEEQLIRKIEISAATLRKISERILDI